MRLLFQWPLGNQLADNRFADFVAKDFPVFDGVDEVNATI